ncbi:DNA sulfur modification protein DndB (plasmid) [Klebsiella pneumoniae]
MRQQFFADINNNASKPAAAISMAYNNNDPVNQLAMYLAQNVSGLAGSVDFEHNAVPAKSSRLISLRRLMTRLKRCSACAPVASLPFSSARRPKSSGLPGQVPCAGWI